MLASDVKDIKDLPKFFKKKSKDIGKAFSDEIIEIGTIRSKSIESKKQEISFKLKLLSTIDKNVRDTNFHK